MPVNGPTPSDHRSNHLPDNHPSEHGNNEGNFEGLKVKPALTHRILKIAQNIILKVRKSLTRDFRIKTANTAKELYPEYSGKLQEFSFENMTTRKNVKTGEDIILGAGSFGTVLNQNSLETIGFILVLA